MRSRDRKMKTVNALSLRQSNQWLATALPRLSRRKPKELSASPESGDHESRRLKASQVLAKDRPLAPLRNDRSVSWLSEKA